MITPDSKRQAVRQAVEVFDILERRTCQVIGQPCSTQHYDNQVQEDEELLRQRIIELASQYGRYGNRRVTLLLRNEGWVLNLKRVQRIWWEEGQKVSKNQP